MKSTKKQAPG